MGLFSFISSAGSKIFKSIADSNKTKADKAKAEKLMKLLAKKKYNVNDLDVLVDGERVIVYGTTKTSEEREKIILTVGNVKGVSVVDDEIKVKNKTKKAPSDFYTVAKGDSLSKIAKKYYGSAKKYDLIFKANQPMLKNPDKIFPGQVLRIPKI